MKTSTNYSLKKLYAQFAMLSRIQFSKLKWLLRMFQWRHLLQINRKFMTVRVHNRHYKLGARLNSKLYDELQCSSPWFSS